MAVTGGFIVPHPPLIIPEIGKGQQIKIQATIDAYKQVSKEIKELKPDTIIIVTPHSVVYADYLHISPGKRGVGDFRAFGKADIKFAADYDRQFITTLSKVAQQEGITAGTLGEKDKALDHGTMIPMYFINQHYQDYKLVRISISGVSFIAHYQFGKCIAQVAAQQDKNIVVVASGDLSHKLIQEGPYGFAKEGPVFDREVTTAMQKGDFFRFLTLDRHLCDAAAECGLRSFIIMAGALDGKSVDADLLSYEGPYGVGYAVASFVVTNTDESRKFDLEYEKIAVGKSKTTTKKENIYVKLARESLEYYLKTNKYLPQPADLPEELIRDQAGVFVSLKINGQLRGCIGTISATKQCVADEIIHNAVSAGVRDPRFHPVAEHELKHLVYSVDVLGKPEPISSVDQLDPKRYGIIVSFRGRKGLLLPNLDGVDTVNKQLKIALQKAGISAGEDYKIERFKVVRYQ